MGIVHDITALIGQTPFVLLNTRSLVGLGAIALTACTQALDTSPLETDIRQAIRQQGGSTLKAVTCPKNIPPAAGKHFDCIGELDSGDALAIPVQQTAPGKTTWEVPNAKGLLNLDKLAALFQQTLQQEGKPLTVNCGAGYRSVRPGDSFECKVKLPPKPKPGQSPEKQPEKSAQSESGATPEAGAIAVNQSPSPNQPKSSNSLKSPKSPELITVMVDPQGNINWQQVFPAPIQIATASSTPPAAAPAVSKSDPVQAAENRKNLSTEALNDVEQRSD